MAELVYALCALLSLTCTVLLFRGYRQSRTQLLLWSSLCFVGLTMNNMFLFIDLVLIPDTDILGTFWRNFTGAVAGTLLLFGLIWDLT